MSNAMMSLNTLRFHIPRIFVIHKRYRYKKKWAKTQPSKTPTQLALSYFDSFYKPVYGDLWPPTRVSLLSRQKYGALVNNFADTEETLIDLITNGADDIIQIATETPPSGHVKQHQERRQEEISHPSNSTRAIPDLVHGADQGQGIDEARIVGGANLNDFMPVKRIISERDELMQQEVDQGFYQPHALDVKVVPDKEISFPTHLKMFAHGRGDISMFRSPKNSTGNKLDIYPMDAASVLPVLALDLRPDDRVLDLCAAPGGKTLAMLQTLLPDQLVCVDSSYSRVNRLRGVLRQYVPRSYTAEKKVEIVHGNGIVFCEMMQHDTKFDKILVDVPCYTDRHVLHNEENNIFRPSRQKERLQIQETQKHLLCSALKLCKIGGTVVYSTCTLAPPQNDGIIQAALEHLWQTSSMDCVVMDTTTFADRFREIFEFYPRCRFGQLVLPNLTANFGPMYFCKLKRLS